MQETNAREYSIAAVARGVAALGYKGPKEQSIRNKEGSDFRELIAAYAGEYQKRPEHRRPSDDDDFVDSIGDHRSAARVRWLLNHVRSLQRRNDYLHAAFQKLSAVELAPERVGHKLTAARMQFTDMEVNAVRKFMASVTEVLDCSFDPDTGALLHDRTGLEAGPPGLHQAMLKIMKAGA